MTVVTKTTKLPIEFRREEDRAILGILLPSSLVFTTQQKALRSVFCVLYLSILQRLFDACMLVDLSKEHENRND